MKQYLWRSLIFAVVVWLLLSEIYELGYSFDRKDFDFVTSTQYFLSIAASTTRWAIGAAIGISLGLFIGTINQKQLFYWKTRKKFIVFDFEMIFTCLRYTPVISLPAIVIFFAGIQEQGKIFIIAVSSFIPVWLVVKESLENLNQHHLIIARGYGLSNFQVFYKIVIPSILTPLCSGIRLSLSAGWLSVVASEMLGIIEDGSLLGDGLGYRLWKAQELSNFEIAFICVCTFSIIGIVTDRVFVLLYSKMFEFFGVKIRTK